MIRITFGKSKYDDYSNKTIEFKSDYQFREILSNSFGCNTIINSIIKVEKQVKDLTLDEMYKLRIEGFHYMTINDNIKYFLYYYYDCVTLEKNQEDYIDITSIVKNNDIKHTNDIKYTQEEKHLQENLK